MSRFEKDECYGVLGENLERVWGVALRLFKERTLNGDAQRDLAQAIEHALRDAAEVPLTALPTPTPEMVMYDWRTCPQKYKDLSVSGGDEDWVYVAKKDHSGKLPYWFWEPTEEGIGDEEYASESQYGEDYFTGLGHLDFFEHEDEIVCIVSHA